jgi:hypothetical protein
MLIPARGKGTFCAFNKISGLGAHMLYSQKVMDYAFDITTQQTTATAVVFGAAQEQHEDWQEHAPARKDVTGP